MLLILLLLIAYCCCILLNVVDVDNVAVAIYIYIYTYIYELVDTCGIICCCFIDLMNYILLLLNVFLTPSVGIAALWASAGNQD